MGVTRISVSLDKELVAKMDSFMKARGVDNRSGLVAAALESFMMEHAVLEKSGTRLHGAIVVFYRTGKGGGGGYNGGSAQVPGRNYGDFSHTCVRG